MLYLRRRSLKLYIIIHALTTKIMPQAIALMMMMILTFVLYPATNITYILRMMKIKYNDKYIYLYKHARQLRVAFSYASYRPSKIQTDHTHDTRTVNARYTHGTRTIHDTRTMSDERYTED
jgi:hypothetical protein